MNCFRGRGILDQLYQVILIDHFPRGCGQIAANFKRVRVGHGNLQLALATFNIVQHVFQTANQIFPFGIQGFPQNFRIGQDKIGRGHRIGKLAGIKLDLLGGFVIQPVNIMDDILHPLR